ncbi:MAG: NADH-quinone oxidoreductase subunit C [Deltaproteobacteria bacterium]|nr:MAG: NADH-quinone oxidoreductase subunit C [Deltaproteobacteria bacterium]
MEPAEIYEALATEFGDAVTGFTPAEGGIKDAFCLVAADKLVDVCTFLKTDPRLRFDFLQCITGVDYPRDDKLVSVYHLYSYEHHHTFVIKVEVPRDRPVVPSVCGVWRSANWNEREQYDLLGLQYVGHPDLRRLLMPDDWVGHPMRKDYQEADRYRTMPTTRYSVLELLAAYDKEHPQTEGMRPRVVDAEEDK